MNGIHLKKGDTVAILTGVDKGKKGKILSVDPKNNKIVVEGINIRSKHVKPRKQGEEGGIVKVECAINASKANLICPKCGKTTRNGYKIEKDQKVRVCKKCNATIK